MIPPLATTHVHHSSNHSLLYGRWSTSGSEWGVTHISCHYKNTIEGTGENKTNEQTRTICLGLTQEQKGSKQHYISDSIHGLTLAWITRENSIKQLECRHLLTRSSLTVAGPSCHADSRLCYGVRSRPPLSVSPSQLLSAPLSNQLFPRTVTTSGPAEISSPKTLCLVSRQNRQRNRLLAGYLHNVTNWPTVV